MTDTYKDLPLFLAGEIDTVADVSSLPTNGVIEGSIRYVKDVDTLYTYDGSAWNIATGLTSGGSSTDNAIARWDGTGGAALQDSNVIIDDSDNVTGIANITITGYVIEPLEVGDPGLESGGINVNGVTYDSALKINDIGGTEPAQFHIHRHSTTLQAILAGSRSNTNDNTHAAVTNGMNLFEIIGCGWTSGHYDIFGSIQFKADAAGTISGTSSPGTIDFMVTPDASNVQASAMTIRSDKKVEFKSTTATTVPYLDANKALVSSAVTPTELGYMSGVSSAIQTQLDAKLDDFTSTTDNAIVRTNGTAGEAVQDSGVLIDDTDNVSGVGNLGLSGTITIGGDVTLTRDSANVLRTADSLIIDGDLTVSGTTTTVDTTNLVVTDSNILLNDGAVAAPADDVAGISIERGATGADASLVWNETNNRFKMGLAGSEIDITDVSSAQTVTGKTMTRIANTFTRTFTTYSTTQTLDPTVDDVVLVSGNISLNLPAVASSTGVEFTIKKTDSNATTVTLDGNASETIDGATTFSLTQQYEAVTICCSGSEWFII